MISELSGFIQERRQISKDFHTDEIACTCCGEVYIHQDLMVKLQKMRKKIGVPMEISSGYRCASHNKDVGGAEHSYHLQGLAVDILCGNGKKKHDLLSAAFFYDFVGIGIYRNFLHLDLRNSRPVVWVWE